MTYKIDFSGDFGYELSSYDINVINGMGTVVEKARYCDEIIDRENGYKKIVKRFGEDVIQYCSENGYIMFSVNYIND